MLPSVLEAEKKIMESKANKEYAGIVGNKDFVKLSMEFAYGQNAKVLKEKRVVGVQVS